MKETTIYISKENLLTNYSLLTEFANTPVWPVLKSNAYGHGIDQVAECLQEITSEYFIVQNYFEAEQIWNTLPDQQILMLGTEPFSQYQKMDLGRLTPVVGSIELLKHLCNIPGGSTSRNISVHLKLNTGMNRQGFDPADIPQIITLLQENPHVSVEGILTHFSDADGPDTSFTQKQYACFEYCVVQFQEAQIKPTWIHAANSAGLSKIAPNLVNASRAGIALYGLNPLDPTDEKYDQYKQLQPVLSLHTYVTHVRSINPGEHVGYGNTHTAQKETHIATIPVGYYEGIPRITSNKGVCSTLNGKPLPVVGRVSMNLITLDSTSAELCAGDEVVVYSSNQDYPNSVIKNAISSGTIPYELTTNLKPHLPRVIV